MFDSDYDDDEYAVYDDLDSSPQPHRNDDGNGAMTRIQMHRHGFSSDLALTCSYCYDVFTSPKQVDLHVKEEHVQLNDKIYGCTTCDRRHLSLAGAQGHFEYGNCAQGVLTVRKNGKVAIAAVEKMPVGYMHQENPKNRQSEVERIQSLNERERERQKAKAAEFHRLTSSNESLKIQVEQSDKQVKHLQEVIDQEAEASEGMKTAIERKNQEIKGLQSEVETLRHAAIEERAKKEVGKEKAAMKSTKTEKRAVFRRFYMSMKSSYFEYRVFEGYLAVVLLIDLLTSLYCLHESELSGICLLATVFGFFLAAYADFVRGLNKGFLSGAFWIRIVSVGVIACLNIVWSRFSSSNLHFSLFALKLILALICTLSFISDEKADTRAIAKVLEQATGLELTRAAMMRDILANASDAKDTEVPAPAETRIVELTKTASDDIGMVIFRADGAHIVHVIIPRGIVERQGEIKIGDEILSVNGVNVRGATIEFVKDIMSNIDGPFKTEVVRSTNDAHMGTIYNI